MYGVIRLVLYAGGGIGVVYALINLFGKPLNSLIGLAIALALFFISRYVAPPEAEEAPPPDIDMTTDYRKEMAKARRQHQRELEAAASAEKKEPESPAQENKE